MCRAISCSCQWSSDKVVWGKVSQQFSWKPRKHWLQNTLMGIFDRKLEFIINFQSSSGYFTRVSIITGASEHLQLNAKVEGPKSFQWTYVCMTWPGQNFMHRVHRYVEILQSFLCHYSRNQNEPSKLARAFLTIFTLGIATVNFTTTRSKVLRS